MTGFRRCRAIGLMSGTSLDGVDAAFIITDGRDAVETGPSLTVPYDVAFRERLRNVLGGTGPVAAVEQELTAAHAEAVRALMRRHAIGPVDLIGFHGHTILHQPRAGRTWQIGDGARLAALTGIDVVADFRAADVAAGGEGAPLAPLYHRALAAALARPLAVLNLGGVGNVTWIGNGADDILAFDTGPGNALIDDWMRLHTGRPIDPGGALAGSGRIDAAAVARFLADPYFRRLPPKSLDRDNFARFRPAGLSPADGAATLTAMTAAAVAAAMAHFPAPPRRWLVTGGGRHNATLMALLKARLGAEVAPVEAAGWDGDALEAQAFAYLAVRSLEHLPLSVATTTGVRAPTGGGVLHRAR
ncbi:MAG TPA: anhydro-N-acetylmuramic acid kinase [Stellaceae bacterium]|nr:anhydro-N-acetylmuramic acid kinase [Stellaceae bacterium]